MAKAHLANSRSVDANTTNAVRLLTEFYNTVVWRDVRIDDYGIDALLEFFPEQRISGRYMPLQLKGTTKHIESLKRSPEYVSCKIKSTTLEYGQQDVLPVLVVFAGLYDRVAYYGILQDAFGYQEGLREWAGKGDELTGRLPSSNYACFEDKDFGTRLWGLYEEYLGQDE